MTPFVLSSFDSVPEHLLLGFCWAGADLVIGDEGYARYRAGRARDIAPGEDGAYVVVSRNGQEISIGTDFCGYAKLFLYRQGNAWAVSNSFHDLIAFVGARGLAATICEPQLRTFMIPGHLGQQLMSLKTSINEIELVPANCRIAIVKGTPADSVRLVRTQAVEAIDAEAKGASYKDALGKYLGTWVGRFKTMFESELRIPIDLSGGRDSRAVLGLALLACKELGLPRDRFYVRSSVQKNDDFQVAQAIAKEFNLDLNRDSGAEGDDGASVYQNWKQHALGVYAPVYFFDAGMWRFSLTGGGGESHRPFYAAPDFDDVFMGVPADSVWKATLSEALIKTSPRLGRFFARASGLAGSSPDDAVLRRDAHEGLHSVRCGYEASLDETVVHYRHYRDRFHFGYGAVERSNISPLASRSLRVASALCGKDQFKNAQVIADLMLACDPKLASMPFDKSSKALSRANIQDHTAPDHVMDHADLGGRVFGASSLSSRTPDAPSKNPILQLVDDFETAEARIRAMGLLPRAYVERAKKAVARMSATGKRDRTADYHATRVSHVVLAGELAPLAGLSAVKVR